MHFHAPSFGPSFSGFAFSCGDIWSCIFRSCIFCSSIFSAPFIMCIEIIRNNSVVGGRARAEVSASATERVALYCTWRPSALATRPHGQVGDRYHVQEIWWNLNVCFWYTRADRQTSKQTDTRITILRTPTWGEVTSVQRKQGTNVVSDTPWGRWAVRRRGQWFRTPARHVTSSTPNYTQHANTHFQCQQPSESLTNSVYCRLRVLLRMNEKYLTNVYTAKAQLSEMWFYGLTVLYSPFTSHTEEDGRLCFGPRNLGFSPSFLSGGTFRKSA